MKTHIFRLHDGSDLKKEIEGYVAEKSIQSGAILACVAGLSSATLRMPGAKTFIQLTEELEVVAVTGTLSPEGCHIHIAVSDSVGKVLGGHLSNGCTVRLTAEVVLFEEMAHRLGREFDEVTGFKELAVYGSDWSRGDCEVQAYRPTATDVAKL